jgi:hypothetical protein
MPTIFVGFSLLLLRLPVLDARSRRGGEPRSRVGSRCLKGGLFERHQGLKLGFVLTDLSAVALRIPLQRFFYEIPLPELKT